jgi:putative inorganic carbon (HCO3(-)) transporter
MGLAVRAGGGNQKWLFCLALGCLGVGALTGANPGYGLAAALGIALTVAALAELTVGLVLFTFLSFFEVVTSSGGAASLMKVIGLLIFASWLARELTGTREAPTARPATHPVFLLTGVGLVAWSTLSILWADNQGVAFTSSYRFLLNLLLFPIVLSVVRRRDQLIWIMGAFVLGAAVSALYGFAVPGSAAAAQAGRLTGSVGDPNDQAAVLVAAIPMALALAGVFRNHPGRRLLMLLAAVVALAGTFNTFSRGGLIALGVVMVAGVAFGGRWRPVAAVLLALGILASVTYFVAIAPASSTSHITSTDTSGRSDLWRVALRMIAANPVSGVGAGGFQYAAVRYVNQPGAIHSALLIVDRPHVDHDVYLEMLADLGVPGLFIFLSLVLASTGAAARAAWLARERGDQDLELMARALGLSMIGFIASDVFLSGQFSKQLWLVMALCPAVMALARTQLLLSIPAAAR